jgi:hypothetical protein
MWRRTSGEERQRYLQAAADLMKDHERFYQAMHRVTLEWPYSCEVNLTTNSINQQAWIGHAGTVLATGSPEDVTRQAWHTLTKDQQDLANAAADRAIAEWKATYRSKSA